MTFEKHLSSVSRAASQKFGILRRSECSMIDRFMGDAFGVLSCQFWSIVLQSGARQPIHTLNYRCALVAHRYTYALPRCRTLQYSKTFIPFSVSLWNDLANSVFDGVSGGFQEQGQRFFIVLSCSIPTIVFYFFPFLFFLSIGWYCGAGVFGLIRCTSLSLSLALPTFFNNNDNNVLTAR